MKKDNFSYGQDVDTLIDFIRLPLHSTDEVFDIFRELPNAIYRESSVDHHQQRFVYIEGTRENKVLLVAHADTVWYGRETFNKKPQVLYSDTGYQYLEKEEMDIRITHDPAIEDGIIFSNSFRHGIGADDRSGLAILWLLKDMGHSILVVDGEERGMIGSSWLMSHNKDIGDRLNDIHSFVIQFDRRGSHDFKCYDVGSDPFRQYLSDKTGYKEPERYSFTDIVTLCTKITGVNLSVGYYHEHTQREMLVISEWQNTLDIVRVWLTEEDLPRFEIQKTISDPYDSYYGFDSDDFIARWDKYQQNKRKAQKRVNGKGALNRDFDDELSDVEALEYILKNEDDFSVAIEEVDYTQYNDEYFDYNETDFIDIDSPSFNEELF
jgi:hypothetical protein